jgi:hypothetical protein
VCARRGPAWILFSLCSLCRQRPRRSSAPRRGSSPVDHRRAQAFT